jgi:uncharacterized protein with PIN domain
MVFCIAPHLAFLVQWLRVLGINARLWSKKDPARQGEAVVQWKPYPLPLGEIRMEKITLSASTPQALLKEFFEVSGFRPEVSKMFKRCLRCNTLLTGLTPEEALAKWPELPPYVYQTQHHFNWCEKCRQLFWAGTHVRNMICTLEEWGIIGKEPEKE